MNKVIKENREQRTENSCGNSETCQALFLGSLTGHGASFAGAIFNIMGICPTLTTMQGGGRQPHILIKGE